MRNKKFPSNIMERIKNRVRYTYHEGCIPLALFINKCLYTIHRGQKHC